MSVWKKGLSEAEEFPLSIFYLNLLSKKLTGYFLEKIRVFWNFRSVKATRLNHDYRFDHQRCGLDLEGVRQEEEG